MSNVPRPDVTDTRSADASRALSPIKFLLRSAQVWASRVALSDDQATMTYAEFLQAAEEMAAWLVEHDVGAGDRVAVMLPNDADMLQAHFAVPGIGAVVVPINTRLSVTECTYILEHSGATVLIAHPDFSPVALAAAAALSAPPLVAWSRAPSDDRLADHEIVAGQRRRQLTVPEDDESLLSINYTSGTTGTAKGVMYTHRGAYLHSLGVIAESGLGPRSVYLWTLPMFHCNGWAYIWAITATGGRHVCLPQFEPSRVWGLLEGEKVTHFCAAPTVLTLLGESPSAVTLSPPVRVFTGGAPPAPALIERCEAVGFSVTHLYGLTETYGPLCVCAWQPEWDELGASEQAGKRARQGVATIVTEPLRVVDDDLNDVPPDGETIGEVVMRGNNVTTGYYRDPEGTRLAFKGGWFHSGDLAVMHPDGYLELKDRAKDIIISGGENISTIEVEQAILSHPDVSEVAVVAAPDERWGEIPRAFVVLVTGASTSTSDIRDWVGSRLARFKIPRIVELRADLPKTATGKIQKYALRGEPLPDSD